MSPAVAMMVKCNFHQQEAQRATYHAPENNVPLFDELARAAILFFRSVRKTQSWYRRLRPWFLSSSVEFCSAVSEEKSKMSQPIRGQHSHLVFLIGPINTNLVEDLKILLPVKFRCILFSGFRGKVENVSANQRPGRPSCFFQLARKNTNLVEDIETLIPIKFCWILFCSFRGEIENVSTNQRPGRPFCFSDRPEKHTLGRGHWDLASCQVLLNSIQRRSRKCLSKSEARVAILFFRLARKP